MFTMPAGQCHYCREWKDNSFGQCDKCHKFQPMKSEKQKHMSAFERNKIQIITVKYLFMILKYVHFFVMEKFDFTKCDILEVRNLVHDAFNMMHDPNYKSSEHPDLDLHNILAAILYKLEIPCSATQYIDECNLMYGYGKCNRVGDFQFTIPHRFLKSGTTLRTFPSFICDLETKREAIQFHAYKEVA